MVNELWLISSGLYRNLKESMYPGLKEQKERSEIDGLWCMYRRVMRKYKA